MFEDYINQIKKELILKRKFINLGDFVIEDERVVCYVDKKFIKKNTVYNIDLWWLGNKLPSTKNILKQYGLDKPLCYVFDGIEFDRTVRVFAYGPAVIFKNCIFYDGINIEIGSDVTFENNLYFNKCGSYYKSNTFFKNFCDVDNLRFINDNFINSSELISDLNKPKFGMDLSLNTLEIINCNMIVSESSDFSVRARNIIMNNSIIEGGNVLIEAYRMTSDNDSKIMASKGIYVDIKDDGMNRCNVEADYLLYNGMELINSDINSREVQVQVKRLEFIKELKDIRDRVNQINKEELDERRLGLNKRFIGKVLKRVPSQK